MALPGRPVVAVVGDGSSLYGIQGLWSAARYGVGVLYVILVERRLRDHGPPRGAPRRGRAVAGLRRGSQSPPSRAGFGCEAHRIATHDELVAALDEAVPTLASRTAPLLLDVEIAPTAHFAP